ncbi:hypothetical protein BDN72DRAFT_874155 [Pluteus cervinus]|uniref:Uncharacterized protein n=1 Tax=Pluteus cervinus TaxID=181527 RepID=A0ACD3BDL8_9AGAR|nr:hypothetical protein BDN72DRAFT_874155 [Pluteus cervinus]
MSEKKRGRPAKSKGTLPGQRTLVDLFSRTKSLNGTTGSPSNSNGTNTPTEPPASQTTTSSQPEMDSSELEPLQKSATVSTPEVEVIEILDDELLPATTPISGVSEPSEPPSSPRSSVVEIVDEMFTTKPSTGSQENAIVIEDSTPKPIRVSGPPTARTNASTKIHPFFARMAPKSEVEESHKTRGPAKNPGVPYPDAASQHVRGSQTDFSSHRTTPLPFTIHSRQSLPAEICDMVLQSLQTDYEAKHSIFPLITSTISKEAYRASIPNEHIQGHPAIQTVLSSSTEGSQTVHQLWVDKWHPKQARDVLGNENNALYLRDWLQALKLKTDFSAVIQTSMKNNPKSTGGIKKGGTKEGSRGVKRPRVIRTASRLRATKKRRIDSEDEDEQDINLVFSDPLTPDDFADDLEQEYEAPIVDMSHLHAPGTQVFDNRVTNTILLVGPHGSGKTASVYACAEELGWEVFEVYPGIGRRNGASIDNLVGEVGKNHIVRNTRPRTNETTRNALSVLMSRDKKESSITTGDDQDDLEGSVSAIETPLTRSETPTEAEHETKGDNVQSNVQQSLILLEEVDILFKDDVNFWPTVTELIRNCRRPVILTCNDITLVPLDNLPIQMVLSYQACPSPVAASYLQALCYSEGHQVERESLLSLYELTYEVNPIDLPDAPVISGNGDLPVADLRRTIHWLQMGCVKANNITRTDDMGEWEISQEPLEEIMEYGYWERDGAGCHEPEDEGSGLGRAGEARAAIEQVLVHADLISFADSQLMRKSVNSRWTLDMCGRPTADEELGYSCVEQDGRLGGGFVYYDRDEEIASSAIRLSRGMAGVALARGRGLSASANDGTSFRPRGLFRARAEHQKWVGQMLRNHFKRAARTLAHEAMHLDYQPMFRQMIEAEDAEEEHRRQTSSRQTRNSSGYTRVYGLTEEEREGYRRACLCPGETWRAKPWQRCTFVPVCNPNLPRLGNTTRHAFLSVFPFSKSAPPRRAQQPPPPQAPMQDSPDFSRAQNPAKIPSPSHNGSAHKDSSSRLPPVAPLAPLEYLQNQRRGSITDPSLHAAPTNSISKLTSNTFRQSIPPHLQQDLHSFSDAGGGSGHGGGGSGNGNGNGNASANGTSRSLSDPRPASPYVFGDATAHSNEGSAQIRKLLHSPTTDNTRRHNLSHEEEKASRDQQRRSSSGQASGKVHDPNRMAIDDDNRHDRQTSREPSQFPPQFDYNMRRHSIAIGHHQYLPPPHGTKRKMSTDRNGFAPVGEEIDPQLVGPGVPSVAEAEAEAPAAKRRGSTFDAQKIAQLSLNERRNSVDSRSPGTWWLNGGRREGGGVFPGVYGSEFTGGETPHGRLPAGIATFAWPVNSQQPDHPAAPPMQNEGDTTIVPPHNAIPPVSSRPFDPHNPNIMPPLNFPPDRRMSVPDTVLPPAAGPTRVLRSRSRPPSRQMQSQPDSDSNTAAMQDDGVASASSPSGGPLGKKDSGSTPYSRSPELRVSHKLAERKRRKEMKELFDELRDHLPADRGMKASKWEILSKAIDFVQQLKQSHQDMLREIEMLRHELDAVRQGAIPGFPGAPPPHAVVYQGPVPGPYPPGALPPHAQPPPSHPVHAPPPGVRPTNSPNGFSTAGPPSQSPSQPMQNGNMNRVETTSTT